MTQKPSCERSGIIFREYLLYLISRYFSEFLLAVRGFIIAKYLGPSQYGLWTIMRTIYCVAEFSGLGTAQGMSRQVPYASAKGSERQDIHLIQQTSFTFGFLVSLSFAGVIFLLTVLNVLSSNVVEYRLVCVAFLSEYMYHFMRLKFQSDNNINDMIGSHFFFAVLNTVLGLVFLFYIQVRGLLIAVSLSHITILVCFLIKKKISVDLRLNWQHLNILFRTGFPVMMLALCFYLMHRLDSFIVFTMLGETMTGYYGIASFISLLVSHLSFSLSIILFPKMMKIYGKNDDLKDIEHYYTRPVNVLSLTMPVILGLIYILIDIPFFHILPRYMPGLDCVRILIVSLFFASIVRIPTNILVAANRHLRLMIIVMFIISLGALTDYIVIKLGYGIVGVAYATAATFCVISLVCNHFVLVMLQKSPGEILKMFMFMNMPFFYCVISLAVLNMFIHSQVLWMTSLIRAGIFLILMIPLLVKLDRDENVILRFREIFIRSH